jgi:hypothetical protein
MKGDSVPDGEQGISERQFYIQCGLKVHPQSISVQKSFDRSLGSLQYSHELDTLPIREPGDADDALFSLLI